MRRSRINLWICFHSLNPTNNFNDWFLLTLGSLGASRKQPVATLLCPMPLAPAGKRSKKHPGFVAFGAGTGCSEGAPEVQYRSESWRFTAFAIPAGTGLPEMKPSMHPAAPDHLPGFIVAPGEVDVLFFAVTILLAITIVIIGTVFRKRFGTNNFINRRSYVIQAEVLVTLVLIMILTQNKYFGFAALLLVFIPIPDFVNIVKSKIARRWRAGSVDLSATLHQAAETSETEMPLGVASRQADDDPLTQRTAVARDPKKWLLH